MTSVHLRGVSDSDDGDGTPPVNAPSKAPPRQRSRHALPTDRSKFEKGPETLRAFSVLSRGGAESVGGEELANMLKVSINTAVLNNMFFMDMGLITRPAKGRYLPVPEVNEFRRRHSFGDEAAGAVLAPLFVDKWPMRTLVLRDDFGPMNREDARRALADEAGADDSHLPQIDVLMQWLEFVGLVDYDGDKVVLNRDDATGDPAADEQARVERMSGHAGPSNAPTPAQTRAYGGGTGPTFFESEVPGAGATGAVATNTKPVQDRPTASPVVLAWSFDMKITVEDLAKLSPEQIKALYEAMGAVAAIKASLKEE